MMLATPACFFCLFSSLLAVGLSVVGAADQCPVPSEIGHSFTRKGPFNGPTCSTGRYTVQKDVTHTIRGILALLAKRKELQKFNRAKVKEWNTEHLTAQDLEMDKQAVDAGFRPYAGSHSYPGVKLMGAYGQHFSNNTPGGTPTESIKEAKVVADKLLHSKPDEGPRQCSTDVNQWFAIWIQLNVEDWVQSDGSAERGPNLATCWWDLDSTYGRNYKEVMEVRMGSKGLVDAEKIAARSHQGQWVGVDTLKYLFAKEHNLIASKLAETYPDLAGDDDRLFGTARLITSATVARIHTLHWTTILLQAPGSRVAQKTLWDGIVEALVGQSEVKKHYVMDKLPSSLLAADLQNTLEGIVGGNLQHEYNFTWTEEFSLVYRLHAMLPDSVNINGNDIPFSELVSEPNLAPTLGFDAVARGITDGFACLLTLQNYPAALANLHGPHLSETIDLGELDVASTRKRGLGSFNDLRRALHVDAATSFEDLVTNGAAPTERDRRLIKALSDVYDSVEDVDALVGWHAEPRLPMSLLGIVQYLCFVLMTQSRLESDPFYTTKYNKDHYTDFGLKWVEDRTFGGMLTDHFGITFASDHVWAGFFRCDWVPPVEPPTTLIGWFCHKYEPTNWGESPWFAKPGYTTWYLIGDALLTASICLIFMWKRRIGDFKCQQWAWVSIGFGFAFVCIDSALHVVGERFLLAIPWKLYMIPCAITLIPYMIWLLVDALWTYPGSRGGKCCTCYVLVIISTTMYLLGLVFLRVASSQLCHAPEGSEFPYAEHACTHFFLTVVALCVLVNFQQLNDGDLRTDSDSLLSGAAE